MAGRPRFRPAATWIRSISRICCRTSGSSIVRFTGRDSTGKWLDEVYPDFHHSESFQRFSKAAEGVPVRATSRALSNPRREHYLLKKLYLPFATDGETVDLVMCMTTYLAEEEAGEGENALDSVVQV